LLTEGNSDSQLECNKGYWLPTSCCRMPRYFKRNDTQTCIQLIRNQNSTFDYYVSYSNFHYYTLKLIFCQSKCYKSCIFFLNGLVNHNGDLINDKLAERLEGLFRDTYLLTKEMQTTIQDSVNICQREGMKIF
jgi:hypothetical protein